ncbi:MAG TPA: DUF2269 domain-containing protein [Candidatus Eremiobacteraceae bacterium]
MLSKRNDAPMYLWFKLIHVAAVIVFLGNISLGVFWKDAADRTRDPRIMAHTLRSIIVADRWFTIPSVIVLLAGGIATAIAEHIPILATGWILWSIILFIISGIAFGPIARAQRAMEVAASEAVKTGALDEARYKRLSANWNVWGMIALLAPVVAVCLMVLKPHLPAFH